MAGLTVGEEQRIDRRMQERKALVDDGLQDGRRYCIVHIGSKR